MRITDILFGSLSSQFNYNVIENDEAVFIEVDMPGYRSPTVSVEDDGHLHVEAERDYDLRGTNPDKKIETMKNGLCLSGKMDEINVDKIMAELKNGVLTIMFPRKTMRSKPGTKARKISVSIV